MGSVKEMRWCSGGGRDGSAFRVAGSQREFRRQEVGVLGKPKGALHPTPVILPSRSQQIRPQRPGITAAEGAHQIQGHVVVGAKQAQHAAELQERVRGAPRTGFRLWWTNAA